MLASKMAALADKLVQWWLTEWLDPWLWVSLAVFLFAMTVLGTKPVTEPRHEKASAGAVAAVRARQALWVCFALAVIVLPGVIAILGSILYPADEVLALMTSAFITTAAFWWQLPAAAWLASLLLVVAYRRLFVPWWTAFKRRFRLRQTGEELSDIRVERERLKATRFLPSKFYAKEFIFFGLDETGAPIKMPDADWRSMHMKVIGPTQTGKGVLLGVLVDQIISKGVCTIVIDPKPDKHLKEIMKKACERAGRRFLELDLNDGSQHRWAPFAGGAQRDRRSRILAAFGMQDTGESADYYKSGERAILDQLLATWSGDLVALRNLIINGNLQDKMSRTLNYVNEWLAVPTFAPQKGRGFSIERALRDSAVVWVRGSLSDVLIIRAATIFIMEAVQEAFRLYRNGRTSHLTLMIDEVKFMVSDTLANALASVAGVDMNMILAYQSLLDLRSLRDKNVNAKSIEDSINVNCKLTLCYQAANVETATWASEMSGTVQKAVTRMETVNVGRWGVEEWENERMVSRTEAPLISENLMLTLPARVGIIFRPGHLATPLLTSWVPVELPPIIEALPIVAAAVAPSAPPVGKGPGAPLPSNRRKRKHPPRPLPGEERGAEFEPIAEESRTRKDESVDLSIIDQHHDDIRDGKLEDV